MPKRIFDKEFKINAVKLVKEQGLSATQASHDLGIGHSTLQRLLREIKNYGQHEAFPGSGQLKPRDEQ